MRTAPSGMVGTLFERICSLWVLGGLTAEAGSSHLRSTRYEADGVNYLMVLLLCTYE